MDVDAETTPPPPDIETAVPPAPPQNVEMENEQLVYNEKRALIMAVIDWLPELYKTKTSSGQLRIPPPPPLQSVRQKRKSKSWFLPQASDGPNRHLRW